ncbi:hypothetical protein NUW58_g8748 [Xylaria curta]|uniref:Uncharacterized protein n=1 Tax=Xylaria curta TaxID=42375 RepID=A0ACC1N4F0_9PEZI|nr:hypothetical protein NUW58_g8748 [Xylaria curta]
MLLRQRGVQDCDNLRCVGVMKNAAKIEEGFPLSIRQAHEAQIHFRRGSSQTKFSKCAFSKSTMPVATGQRPNPAVEPAVCLHDPLYPESAWVAWTGA